MFKDIKHSANEDLLLWLKFLPHNYSAAFKQYNCLTNVLHISQVILVYNLLSNQQSGLVFEATVTSTVCQ